MPNVIVVGAQWGDEGKGKVVDVLTASAEVVMRYGGGANAGHTLVVKGQKLITHLVPSGIVHPSKLCLLGAAMVIDPATLLEELETCRGLGLPVSPDRLAISQRAHVILPYHKLLDGLRESGQAAIGTTRRGIGPCYEDKMARRGVQMWQLTDQAILRDAIEQALRHVNPQLEQHGETPQDPAELARSYAAHGETLAPYLCDASEKLASAVSQGKSVLFEGAQGALLDIDHGTYPYVTSSSTTAGGACASAGIGPTRIHAVLGVVKAYQTRVGGGPFPTELKDEVGRHLQDQGHEYGSTTGRPRRCGWLDVVALRRAVRINGLTGLALTKLDVLSGLPTLRVCTAYALDGQQVSELPPAAREVDRLVPIYEDLPGFNEDINKTRRFEDLPDSVKHYIHQLETWVGVPVQVVSIGPDREDTIMVQNPFLDPTAPGTATVSG